MTSRRKRSIRSSAATGREVAKTWNGRLAGSPAVAPGPRCARCCVAPAVPRTLELRETVAPWLVSSPLCRDCEEKLAAADPKPLPEAPPHASAAPAASIPADPAPKRPEWADEGEYRVLVELRQRLLEAEKMS